MVIGSSFEMGCAEWFQTRRPAVGMKSAHDKALGLWHTMGESSKIVGQDTSHLDLGEAAKN